MKNRWLENRRIKDHYKRYTVYLLVMTQKGPVYLEAKKLAPEVHWKLPYDVVVNGFAFFQGKKLMYVYHLSFPVRVQSGDDISGKFVGLPLP